MREEIILKGFNDDDKAFSKGIIDYIEKLWYAQKLCEIHGFLEKKPMIQTKKSFMEIWVYKKEVVSPKIFNLSIDQFKCYLFYKKQMMGID